MKRILCILLPLLTASALSVKAQVSDSTVTAIFTDFKSYWTSGTAKNSGILPDSSHNLLAFTFRGKTYSTGVNNAILTKQLGSSGYSAQTFKAFPVKNIESTVKAGGATNLAFALKNDGDSTKAAYKAPYPAIHISDVLTDGKNGLDLGTGVTNLPKGGHISFAIKNLNPARVTDAVPDLVFTQIAEPTTNQPDTIFFYDANNNIVGNKKLVYWNSVSKLGTYKLDLYTLTPGLPCNTSGMNGLFEQNGTRDIRMVAFLMTEFGITNAAQANQVKGVQINPCGSSDQAFIAYNVNTINLDVPVVSTQPASQVFCSPEASASATFSVSATSTSGLTYQWKKNGQEIAGATDNVYTATNLILSDTANAYSVTVTNSVGSITSDNAYIKYIIISQPAPLLQYLATGNAAAFSNLKTSVATSVRWQKNGAFLTAAQESGYAIPSVSISDSGSYAAVVTYTGGTCTSEEAVLKTSVVLYSKASGSMTNAATWGVNKDGTGSSPLDFTRSEHTFVIVNRNTAETGGNLTIAGTLDVADADITVSPNTTLQAGRITRSLTSGVLSVTPSSSLVVGNGTAFSGGSDLYLSPVNNTIKNLTITTGTAVLHSALNIASGKSYGVLQVSSGTFNTSDLLTLKSDSLGSAGIAKSAGTISGKVTIEKWVHARRAWRLMGAPVSSTDAPSLNAAWQEGAGSSTDNPHPGYGTHITGGTEANGFDRSPTNNPSLKYINANGVWTGVPNTNKTPVTQYPAYMLFIRGDRSYNILSTTAHTTPATTVMRVTGNINGGRQAQPVSAKGFTTLLNPYAAPVNFARLIGAGSNIKKRMYVWDPTLAGENGVGAWVIVDGTTGVYKTTPPSSYVSTVLQAGQGFMVQTADSASSGSVVFSEDLKDFSATTTNSDREGEIAGDTSLEVNLKLFNGDNSASIADGILYNFSKSADNNFDGNDAVKMYNTNENLSVRQGDRYIAIDSRTAPKEGDSLRLNLSGVKEATYQLEFVPSSLKNQSLSLYDKYLGTFSPISVTDTTRISFTVLPSVSLSKAADRFTIVTGRSALTPVVTAPAVSSLLFTKVSAEAKEGTINVQWNVQNEASVLYYSIEKSTDGIHFAAAGSILASGKGAYSFTDANATAAMGYYRIKGVSKDGSSLYSAAITVSLNATVIAPGMSVYPNPLTGTAFTLSLTGQVGGTYTVAVLSSNGATMFSKSITHAGGTASQKITMNNRLAAGIYYIQLSSATKTISAVTVTAR